MRGNFHHAYFFGVSIKAVNVYMSQEGMPPKLAEGKIPQQTPEWRSIDLVDAKVGRCRLLNR